MSPANEDQPINKDLVSSELAYREKRYTDAFSLYSKLGEGGHVHSQLMVAWMLLQGLGVGADEAQAISWFDRAAALGSPIGSFYKARYLTRQGLHEEALPYYALGAKTGYLPSVFWMGYCASRGKGRVFDQDEAYRYLIVAAKKGHVFAIREVGLLDIKGGRGNLGRMFGLLEVLAVPLVAFFVGLVNKESDLLRA